jgi:hypothetical protein
MRCGARPCSRQIRLTVVWLRPHALAIDRVVQRTRPGGGGCSVMPITRATSCGLIRRGAPDRGWSSRPRTRRRWNRERHLPTACFDTRKRPATDRFDPPSRQARISAARRASRGLLPCTHSCRLCRSSDVAASGASGRPGGLRACGGSGVPRFMCMGSMETDRLSPAERWTGRLPRTIRQKPQGHAGFARIAGPSMTLLFAPEELPNGEGNGARAAGFPPGRQRQQRSPSAVSL